MDKETRLKTYGFKKDIELFGTISLVCSIFGNGSNNNADLILEKTARSESHLATYPDEKTEYGESPYQFDKIGFLDTVDRAKQEDKILSIIHFGINLDELEYADLRKNILASTILARLKYKLVPYKFPTDDLEQYHYYKKYWNSESGSATLEHFENLTKDCYFG